MAVLSLATAGLSIAFAPAATAHDGDVTQHDFSSYATTRALSVVDETDGYFSVESGVASGSHYNQGGSRNASADVVSYATYPAVSSAVAAYNMDSEPNGAVGRVDLTGSAAHVQGFHLGASTNSVEVNQVSDLHTCLPLETPLYETFSTTSVEVDVVPAAGGAFDLLDSDGSTTAGHTRASMFAIPGVENRRGVLSEAEGDTGTYHLLDGTIKVEILEAATARSIADGVNPPVSDVARATVRVTGADGGVTLFDHLVPGGSLGFTDPRTGRQLSLQVNDVRQTVDASGAYHTARNSTIPVRAAYTSSEGVPEGTVTIGAAETESHVKPGGVDCSPAVDTDDDGLSDFEETNTHGTDAHNPDSDNDGLQDGAEVTTHETNPSDPDSDDDWLKDGEEVGTHKTDPNDVDSDDDDGSDYYEVTAFKTDPNDADSDDDGITDNHEYHNIRTDPNDADTDDDGLVDGEEIAENPNGYTSDPMKADTDGGKSSDFDESSAGTDPRDPADDYRLQDADQDGLTGDEEDSHGTDPDNPDSDEDGLTDGAEVNTHETDPTTADSDQDGVKDGAEVRNGTDPWMKDTDADNLDDGGEVTAGTDPLVRDTDGDSLWDGDEVRIGTSPLKKDTDGGSVDDAVEYDRGTDPLNASDDVPPVTNPPVVPPATPVTPVPPVDTDNDDDGLTNAEEADLGTDPNKKHSDGDHLSDGREVERTGTDPLDKDTDGDRLGDFREVVKTRTSPTDADTDNDRLEDGAEVRGFRNKKFGVMFQSNPFKKDSDKDGLGDKAEVTGARNGRFGNEPTSPVKADSDGDKSKDLREVKAGSNPAAGESTPRRP